MRVLIVNTSDNIGGAAVAARRLMDALNNNGVKVKMMVRDKTTDQITVVGLKKSWLQQYPFLWERFVIFMHGHFSMKHHFEMDIANIGNDITRTPEFKEADVIHLHWVNQGMLSLNNIRKILVSGKPVVWTMHDIWPATAICHYTRGCGCFKSHCHHCKLLPGGGGDHDLAAKTWARKVAMLRNYNIDFVACSKWLAQEAKNSALLSGQRITNIPNPIDTRLFHPLDRDEARRSLQLPDNKRIILFVSQRVTDQRKGMDYLVEALQKLVGAHPQYRENTAVAILGGHAEDLTDELPLETFPLGYVSDARRIVEVYSAADLFVLPSLEDNLPNTIMEAMACGVPCVGFKVGGIPEMIDHQKNGYVANYCDAADLANGIRWTLDEANRESLRADALHKVSVSYSQAAVAMRYIEVYNQALAFKHYKI